MPAVSSNFNSKGETRLDIGPGETNLNSANLVKPGSGVKVAVGSVDVGTGVGVNVGVKVAVTVGVNASRVANADWLVSAMTVEM